jgi:hypothetical protein
MFVFCRGVCVTGEAFRRLAEAVHSRDAVSGLTHGFYRYPARFSPLFVRAAIEAFTDHGDVVIDPFMGGATTPVEAVALGRRAVGVDINALAVFVARAKTGLLSETDLAAVRRWALRAVDAVNLHDRAVRPFDWIELGYQRNLSDHRTWPVRKWLELMLHRIPRLGSEPRQVFARAVVLHTAQWALDCRSEVPPIQKVRAQFVLALDAMTSGARALREAVEASGGVTAPVFFNRSAAGLEEEPAVREFGTPRLIVTSPPYPGVHVVYHRWQILGRKETPAPFWIANSLDGNGLSYYTFGDRKQPGLKNYFDTAREVFSSVASIAGPDTMIVQMVAFSEPTWQLPLYLDTMSDAGLREVQFGEIANSDDGRVWRTVPNRKWYADQRGAIAASKEVVLFHRKR